MIDPAEKLRQTHERLRAQRALETPDWRARVLAYHAGEIDDDRVTCSSCEKWRFESGAQRRCAERIGCVEDIPRRCIRWEERRSAQ